MVICLESCADGFVKSAVGHYFWYFSTLVLVLVVVVNTVAKMAKGGVIGFKFFAWAPKSQKYEDSN